MSLIYLLALLGSIAGVAALDWRFRLALPVRPGRTVLVVGMGVLVFVGWDVLAIGQGFFLRGDSPVMTGVLLGPELPIEEPVFLALLCYLALVLYRAAVRMLDARRLSS